MMIYMRSPTPIFDYNTILLSKVTQLICTYLAAQNTYAQKNIVTEKRGINH